MTSPENPRGAREAQQNELTKRLITAAIMIAIALCAAWLGGVYFVVFITIAAYLVAVEWRDLTLTKSDALFPGIAGLAICAAGWLPVLGLHLAAILSILVFAAAAAFATSPERRFWAMGGIVYFSAPVLALSVVRLDPVYGFLAVLFVALVVAVCDTGAYFTGRAIGKTKLAPRLSPGKTREGLAGGLMAALAAGGLFATGLAGQPVWQLALTGLLLAALSQAGDLLESGIKRYFGVKDSGTILPGHGGMMDRVDSLIPAVLLAAAIGVVRGGPEFAGHGLLVWR
jgi:phosphatidate cytidylyltransferase